MVGTGVAGSGLVVACAQARTGGGEQPLLLVNEDEEHLGVDVAGLGDLPDDIGRAGAGGGLDASGTEGAGLAGRHGEGGAGQALSAVTARLAAGVDASEKGGDLLACHGLGVVEDLVIDDVGGVEAAGVGHQGRGSRRCAGISGLAPPQREAAERGTGGTQHDESHQERGQEGCQDDADRAFQEGLNGTTAPPPPSGTGAQEPEAPTAASTPLCLPGALTRILPPGAVSAALRGRAGAARSSCGLGRAGSCGASLGPRTSAGGMVGHRRHRVTSRADARPEAARASHGERPIRSRREAMRPTAPPSAG